MPLSAGMRLGPYEILSPIGAGGMGEVYKARDSRLDRIVAIKVLPAHLSNNDELRQRFEQEARAVSSLNHAHICILFDVGRDNDIDFLVMEYVEGETLAERLDRGAIPWDEAVRHAIDLADALHAAHRAGVIHRDLKPGNVILTSSGPKLLDFGLAKLRSDGATAPDLSAVTEAKPLTEKGAILGTFQYMAPEQLEGKDADARSDIFALGAVIYEMVTGDKAFRGESQANLIAAIMSGNPRAISETDVLSPPSLDRVLSACLEKDPDRRWQSAADLKRNLEWVGPDGETSNVAPSATRGRWLAGLFGCVAGIAATVIAVTSFTGAERRSVQHFQIALGENEGLSPGVRAHVALSPDGSLLAYTALRGGTSRLYLRRMDEQEAHAVPGSEGARSPFFSPDGEWIAFQTYPTDRKLKKVSVHGGTPQTIHDSSLPNGGAWLPDHTIVFGDRNGLFRLPDSGGAAETLIQVDANEGERLFLFPQALPDGKSILFTATGLRSDAVLLSLETASRRTVIENAVNARYVPTGQVLFVRGGALWAVDFDLARQEKVGTERPVLSGVEQRGWASIAFSETGLFVYVPGEEGAWVEETVAWVSRDGQRTPVTSERLDYESLRLSPSGDKIALSTSDFWKSTSDVWILDLESGRQERVTFHKGRDQFPIWTPDGQSLIFASDRDGRSVQLYRQSVVESGEAELLLESDEDLTPLDVSPDGRALAFRQSQDIYLLSLQDQSVSPLVATDASEVFAKFSPDGRFLAYVSDETGQREMYVQPYPPTGGKWQVSRGGANDAVWAADGNELYYLRGTTMVAVRVQLSPGFEVLGERELFEAPPTNIGRSFDVHPSSGRFLFIDKTIESPPQYVNVVTNFFDLLTPGEGQ